MAQVPHGPTGGAPGSPQPPPQAPVQDGLPPRERASLELDETGMATVDGKYHLGASIKVRLDRLDELGRPDVKPA